MAKKREHLRGPLAVHETIELDEEGRIRAGVAKATGSPIAQVARDEIESELQRAVRARVEELKELGRKALAEALVEQLNAFGYDLTFDDVEKSTRPKPRILPAEEEKHEGPSVDLTGARERMTEEGEAP